MTAETRLKPPSSRSEVQCAEHWTTAPPHFYNKLSLNKVILWDDHMHDYTRNYLYITAEIKIKWRNGPHSIEEITIRHEKYWNLTFMLHMLCPTRLHMIKGCLNLMKQCMTVDYSWWSIMIVETTLNKTTNYNALSFTNIACHELLSTLNLFNFFMIGHD